MRLTTRKGVTQGTNSKTELWSTNNLKLIHRYASMNHTVKKKDFQNKLK
jgi:hypothetical protein